MTFNKARARLEILNHIVSSATQLKFGGHYSRASSYFVPMDREDGIVLGSLVSLQSAPKSKWYLSWLVDYKQSSDSRYSDVYTLESIEDGELCDWHNVSLYRYVHWDNSPVPNRWRWTDDQFDFARRWHKLDDGIVRPIDPVFDGLTVTFDTRIGFSLENKAKPKTFDNWKKVRVKDLKDYMDECVALNKL